MPRDEPAQVSAGQWLARAKGDLALAQVPLPVGGFREDLCFHAQQAAEKALKAIFVFHGWTFRYVHDVEELVAGLERHGLAIPGDVRDSLGLTFYAHETRYPGLSEPVTSNEHGRAVAQATAVVRWAESMVSQS